jgi:hypothetical protein
MSSVLIPDVMPYPIVRKWAMPRANTFKSKPVRELLARYVTPGLVVVDPFARDSVWGTLTNDLNPNTQAMYHMPAEDFAARLLHEGVRADIVLLDPPYSPRQIKECYGSAGIATQRSTTRIGMMLRTVKHTLAPVIRPGGLAISFGWNSCGFGIRLGFRIIEIMIVSHGGGRNDTIVTVEQNVGVEKTRTPWATTGWQNYQKGGRKDVRDAV